MKRSLVLSEISEFGKTMGWYFGKKASLVAVNFEGAKAIVVEILKARRGTYQKPFLHVGMVFLVVIGILFAPVIYDRYPASAFSEPTSLDSSLGTISGQQDITNVGTVTMESEKPRRDVVTHEVKSGDTLSSIAKKYGVDADSIAYLNNFDKEQILRPGDAVKVPPVSGVIVKVASGDTIYSLAKKYGLLSAQPIADWPYNTFVDDEKFTLAVGQTLVIPDGKQPEDVAFIPAPRAVSTGLLGSGSFNPGSGQFAWPTNGIITQHRSSYHTGVDIANGIGTNVFAADSGRVIEASGGWNGGYGNHILINHGNGYVTMYAHLSRILVSVGQDVSRGQNIGLMGSTGRSTGSHLHFEIRQGGSFLNPEAFLH